MVKDMPRLVAIHRYPVKGLSAESLERVEIAVAEGLPLDRVFALAHGSTRFDPDAPEWLEKSLFLMLMRNERLAALETALDPATSVLTVKRESKVVARGDLKTKIGRTTIEQFFAAYLKDQVRGTPKVVAAPGHVFMDVPEKVATLINRASVEDLRRVVGRAVDPMRFRANFQIEDAPAWSEFEWVGRKLKIGGASFEVTGRIDRCAATNVEPGTGSRDMQIPKALQTGYGHVEFGVYLRCVEAGALAQGDDVVVEN